MVWFLQTHSFRGVDLDERQLRKAVTYGLASHLPDVGIPAVGLTRRTGLDVEARTVNSWKVDIVVGRRVCPLND